MYEITPENQLLFSKFLKVRDLKKNPTPEFHATSACDIELFLLLYHYFRQIDVNNSLFVTLDQCHPESLHAASGRIMLEEHTSFLPVVAKAIEFYLCDDTMFHVQLWEPTEDRNYKLVWSKDIIPDENAGGGDRRTVCKSNILLPFDSLFAECYMLY